jgi:hypothetical protein
MKIGAVLESLRVPTFTVVTPREEVKGITIKMKPNNPLKSTFLVIIQPPYKLGLILI